MTAYTRSHGFVAVSGAPPPQAHVDSTFILINVVRSKCFVSTKFIQTLRAGGVLA